MGPWKPRPGLVTRTSGLVKGSSRGSLGAGPLSRRAGVHHAGRGGSVGGQRFGVAPPGPGLPGSSLRPLLYSARRSFGLVRPSSAPLVGRGTRDVGVGFGLVWGGPPPFCRGVWASLPISISSPICYDIVTTSLRHRQSIVPIDKTKENILTKAILLRDNILSLLFDLRTCLYILSDYGLDLVEFIQSLYLNKQLHSL